MSSRMIILAGFIKLYEHTQIFSKFTQKFEKIFSAIAVAELRWRL